MKKVHAQNKLRISVTLLPSINALLEQIAENTGRSKSAIVEDALKKYMEYRLEEDAKKIAQIQFDDIPTEEQWIELQFNDNLDKDSWT